MQFGSSTRREFLSTSAAGLAGPWLARLLPALGGLGGLAACAREAAQRGDGFTALSPAEARALAAFAARIIPSGDGLPGAMEAGAVYFADRALASMFADWLEPVRRGLGALDAEAVASGAGAADFAALGPDAQDALIRAAEARADDPFFELARMLVVMGTFADASHGGNRDGAGDAILRVEHAAVWSPPFGYYDAEAAAAGGGA